VGHDSRARGNRLDRRIAAAVDVESNARPVGNDTAPQIPVEMHVKTPNHIPVQTLSDPNQIHVSNARHSAQPIETIDIESAFSYEVQLWRLASRTSVRCASFSMS
jgi:predicted  nucleic acid-binding Zn-ribbon protein